MKKHLLRRRYLAGMRMSLSGRLSRGHTIDAPLCFYADTDFTICLLYTSDAADEEDSVDLGGRRISETVQDRTIVTINH